MRRAAIIAVLLTLPACGRNADDNALNGNATALSNESAGRDQTVMHGAIGIRAAEVRLPAVPGRPGAAYLDIVNNGDALTLASVSSPRAERAEIHESRMEGGVMRMGKLDGLPLPAQATTSLAPGGKHVMLFGLDPALKAGDKVTLILKFADGTSIRVDATAQTMAGDADAHGGH